MAAIDNERNRLDILQDPELAVTNLILIEKDPCSMARGVSLIMQ
jgi:hypothetical protein